MRNMFHGLAGAACGIAVLGLTAPAAGPAVGAVGVSGVIHIAHGVGGGVNTNQSTNWSGYNIGADYPQVSTGTTFTSISGQWTVPTATQHTSGQAEDSATWIGIGGGCIDDNCDT